MGTVNGQLTVNLAGVSWFHGAHVFANAPCCFGPHTVDSYCAYVVMGVATTVIKYPITRSMLVFELLERRGPGGDKKLKKKK